MSVAPSPRWRHRLLFAGGGVLLVFVVLAFVVWWRHTHERIERRVPEPPQGEAAWNPLYLLRQALLAEGISARSRRRLQLDAYPPGARDTILIYSDPRLLAALEVESLLAWVARGGHLIVSSMKMEPRTAWRTRGELLAELDLWPHPYPPPACDEWQEPEDVYRVFCAQERFVTGDGLPQIAWGDAGGGFAYARLAWGEGVVDVMSSLEFLHNRRLPRPPHAALAWQMLAPNAGRGTVHLIYAAQMPPLWQLLLERAPMAWWPLLLAIAAWLWMRTQRFGPLRPAPLPARRALLEHVAASGEYLYRRREWRALHAAMRDAFFARLERRDPPLAALRDEAQHAAIAARSGFTQGEVASALSAVPPMNARELLARIARLQQMRLRL